MAQPNVPAIVFGGLFLGAWLFFVFTFGVETPWTNWGLFGLAIAGGIYASRLLKDTYRVLVWSAIGILLGLVIMFALFQSTPSGIIAILLTTSGAGLIASALPPHPPTVPGAVPPAYPYAYGHYDPNQPPAGYGYGYGGYAPQEPYPHTYDPYAAQQGHPQQPHGHQTDPYAHQRHPQQPDPYQSPPPQRPAPSDRTDWALHEDEDEADRKRKRSKHDPNAFDPNYR